MKLNNKNNNNKNIGKNIFVAEKNKTEAQTNANRTGICSKMVLASLFFIFYFSMGDGAISYSFSEIDLPVQSLHSDWILLKIKIISALKMQ